MRIYLTGFMGSGKTTVGRKLAKCLNFRFIDLDKAIEQSQQMFISHIFKQFGEEQFRQWETEELMRLSLEKNIVISTGGGTPCFNDNMQVMNQTGLTIYLYMSPAALFSRLKKAKMPRPLIDGKSPDELNQFIVDLMAIREPYYKQSEMTINGLRPELTNLVHSVEEFMKI